jgi:hypothetical protein
MMNGNLVRARKRDCASDLPVCQGAILDILEAADQWFKQIYKYLKSFMPLNPACLTYGLELGTSLSL